MNDHTVTNIIRCGVLVGVFKHGVFELDWAVFEQLVFKQLPPKLCGKIFLLMGLQR